ncbi:hypothetical protein GCM10028857_25800 [Salinarchaeum chitinilyticum]
MIFLGAAAVLVTSGALIDDVQGSSQHEIAVDSALQTHQAISEALQSGEARELSVSDGVEMDVQQSGSIAIEMRDGSGGVCSAEVDDVDPVQADMGAIVYETPKGAVVYQGGAIWEEMDGGLSIERAPPISFDNETARISIQTVTAEEDSFEGQMAKPNESMQAAMVEETNRMLTHCPANGYTNLEITVTSPNYADAWKQHFDAAVDTGPNVTVGRPDDQTVTATITNATSAHASRGLRFANVSGPTVVGPHGDSPDPYNFSVDVALTNDGFNAREASVTLGIAGHNYTSAPITVPTVGNESASFANLPLQRQTDLIDDLGLAPNEAHEYTLYLLDGEGTVVEQTTGRFFLESSGGGNVTFFDDSHELVDDEDTLLVNATLINTFTTNATDQTVEFQITDSEVDMPDPVDDPLIDVPAYGGTKGISYEMNVSELRAGTYKYELRHDGVTLERSFTIHDPLENSGAIVGDVRVEAIDPASDVIESGEDFEVRVQLYNTAANDTTTDVSIELLNDSLSTTLEDVAIDGASRTNVTVHLDGEKIADELATRTTHEYEVTIANDGEAQSFPGSFVVLEPDASLQIDDHWTEKDGDYRWINATLANHGNDTGSATATLTIYDNETDDELGSVDTGEPIELGAANQTKMPFGFDVGNLSGAYRYEVSYGEETVKGYFSEGEADTGDGNVSFTAPGNGTVSVLGTEISYFADFGCNRYSCGYLDPPHKGWAPTTVSTILEIDGEKSVIPFNNTATDDSSYYNKTNLNTYDTQDAVYTTHWTQVEGETASLTVSSSYWGVEDEETKSYANGIEDLQPGSDVLDDNPAGTVNAKADTNKEAVQVLTNGDDVPNPETSGEDQRSAKQILEQNGVELEDGKVVLGPYEAIFLFELTEDAYPGMWEDAYGTEGDPDYNDVIAKVSFNPDNPEDVTLTAGDHSVSFGPAPSDPDETNDSGPQDIDFGGGTEGPGTGSQPSSPEPQSPDPGNPSSPEEINVEVGGIVIG